MTDFFTHIPFELSGIILAVGLIITLTTLSRHVVGLRGLGSNASILIPFALLSVEPTYTLPLDALLLYIGYAAVLVVVSHFIRPHTLLHLPKIALTLSLSLLITLLTLAAIHSIMGISVTDWVMPLLIYASITETLYSSITKRGIKEFISLNIETLTIALIAYYTVSFSLVQDLFLAYPWALLVGFVIINILLGRWTGPRLTEVVKYNRILTK